MPPQDRSWSGKPERGQPGAMFLGSAVLFAWLIVVKIKCSTSVKCINIKGVRSVAPFPSFPSFSLSLSHSLPFPCGCHRHRSQSAAQLNLWHRNNTYLYGFISEKPFSNQNALWQFLYLPLLPPLLLCLAQPFDTLSAAKDRSSNVVDRRRRCCQLHSDPTPKAADSFASDAPYAPEVPKHLRHCMHTSKCSSLCLRCPCGAICKVHSRLAVQHNLKEK